MSEVLKQVALSRAIALLKTSGAQYKVWMPDGTVDTNVVEKVPSVRTKIHNFDKDFGYVKDVKDAEVGAILSWPVPNDLHPSFMKALTGTCIRYWGKGQHTVERADNKISVLRG